MAVERICGHLFDHYPAGCDVRDIDPLPYRRLDRAIEDPEVVLLYYGDHNCDTVGDRRVFRVYLRGEYELDEITLVRFDSALASFVSTPLNELDNF